jgi:hypothetical protein
MKPHLISKKCDVQNNLSTGSNYISKPSAVFNMPTSAPFFQLMHWCYLLEMLPYEMPVCCVHLWTTDTKNEAVLLFVVQMHSDSVQLQSVRPLFREKVLDESFHMLNITPNNTISNSGVMSSHATQIKCFFKGMDSFVFSLTYLLIPAAISLNRVKKIMWRNRHLSILRWFIIRWGMKWNLTEIMLTFISEGPIFITDTNSIIYIFTLLTVITITTTVTQIWPLYFGIRVTMLNYINIWILNNFIETIWVIMQLFIDLYAVQCMPTGRHHQNIATVKKWRLFTKSMVKYTGVLQGTVG